MLINECRKLSSIVEQRQYSDSTLLNIGSSTAEVRNQLQPYVGGLLLLLKSRKISVINIDIKEEEGVDYCLDFNNNDDFIKINNLKPDLILASNLLEHLPDLAVSLNKLCLLAKKNQSALIITGPVKYPYHPDPIDNLFRPQSIEEILSIVEEDNLPINIEFYKTSKRPVIASTIEFPQSLTYPSKHFLAAVLKTLKKPKHFLPIWVPLIKQFKPAQAFICILDY